MVVTFSGMVSDQSDVQFQKALPPMVVRLLGNCRSSSLAQLLKASLPISCTPPGMTAFSKAKQSANAPSLMRGV